MIMVGLAWFLSHLLSLTNLQSAHPNHVAYTRAPYHHFMHHANDADDDNSTSLSWLRDAADDELPFECMTATLPTCALDCNDGDLYYRVLAAWCVPWRAVPLKPFLSAWFAISFKKRRALLREHHAYFAELGVYDWAANLLARDDANMLAALPDTVLTRTLVSPKLAFDKWHFVRTGAVRCLAQLTQQRDHWSESDWSSYFSVVATWAPTTARRAANAILCFEQELEKLAQVADGSTTQIITNNFVNHFHKEFLSDMVKK